MVKVIINLLNILFTMISSKLVYCYTAIIGFSIMLLNAIFPSLSKKYNQQSISLDHDELENLQKQISSSFTKVSQSSETFPVSMDNSFNSHVALDVIESQNQRYQDYIKFKVQMKKKQNKSLSSAKNESASQIKTNMNEIIEATQAYFSDLSNDCIICNNDCNQDGCNYSTINDPTSLENAFQMQEIVNTSNSCCCKNNCNLTEQFQCPAAATATATPIDTDLESAIEGGKKTIPMRNPIKNYTSYYMTNLNRKYHLNNNINNNNTINAKAESEVVCEDEEAQIDESISTEDSTSFSAASEDEESFEQGNSKSEHVYDFQDGSNISEEKKEQQNEGYYYYMNSQQGQKGLNIDMKNKRSTDQNIELLNQQVIQSQLHNYFNMNFLQIKKLRLDSNINIHDQLENYCSRKRCPCLKFKRRYQRVRSVQANKKKLPTILENFGY